MNIFRNKKKTQRGITIVEVMIGLLIAAVLAGVAYSFLGGFFRESEAQTTIKQVRSIASALRKNFGITNQYGSVTTTISVQSRTIPDDMRIVGTTTARNIYDGQVTTVPSTLTVTDDVILITFTNVPQAQCMEIVMGSESIARQVRVNNVVVKATDANVVPATVGNQCESAANVPIEWAVGRTGV